MPDDELSISPSELLQSLRLRTPARVLTGRAGSAYRTQTLLKLREDHAAARDAVWCELDMQRELGGVAEAFGLFEVGTQAESRVEFLKHPERGRAFCEAARREITARCPPGVDLQVVIGDGLSATAVTSQIPKLLPLLAEGSGCAGWTFGQPFVVRYCRVGVLNDVGELLDPAVVVLLIGERPGLAAADSLSAYLAYRPRGGHSDANRNLISNIHARGVPVEAAAFRILTLASELRTAQSSGVNVKERLNEMTRDAFRNST